MLNIGVTNNRYSKDVYIIEGNTSLKYPCLNSEEVFNMINLFTTVAAVLSKGSNKFSEAVNNAEIKILVDLPDISDYKHVNNFSDEMKSKLTSARNKGKHGWDNPLLCNINYLEELLEKSIENKNYVDAANYCMMLHYRNEGENK